MFQILFLVLVEMQFFLTSMPTRGLIQLILRDQEIPDQ
jgi:hypothetical protein